MSLEEQRSETDETARLNRVADEIMLDLIDMHAKECIPRRAPLEEKMMNKYQLSPKEVMYCFRRLEMEHPEELSEMHYRSFSRWNQPPKYPTLPEFQNRFSR